VRLLILLKRNLIIFIWQHCQHEDFDASFDVYTMFFKLNFIADREENLEKKTCFGSQY